MAQLSESVTKVIGEFSKLPGIGRKSAERLAYHILRVSKAEALALADFVLIGDLQQRDQLPGARQPVLDEAVV